jgi:hypothetical protein
MTFSQSGQRGQPQTATNLLTLRPAVAQDALCVSVLGMQVFLDTCDRRHTRVHCAGGC